MAKLCYSCGKGPAFGHSRSHSMVASKRRFNANLQKVRIEVKGAPRREYVCNPLPQGRQGPQERLAARCFFVGVFARFLAVVVERFLPHGCPPRLAPGRSAAAPLLPALAGGLELTPLAVDRKGRAANEHDRDPAQGEPLRAR